MARISISITGLDYEELEVGDSRLLVNCPRRHLASDGPDAFIDAGENPIETHEG